MIYSNRKAKIYIALSDSNNYTVTQALNDSKWTLRDDLHIEYKGKETTRNMVKTEKNGDTIAQCIK